MRSQRSPLANWLSILAAGCCAVILTSVLLAGIGTTAGAQEKKQPKKGQPKNDDAAKKYQPPKQETPDNILDVEPYDELRVDEENGGGVWRIDPVEKLPPASERVPGKKLRVVLHVYPDREFDVDWKHIADYRTYHQIVFAEAQKATQQKKFNYAFELYMYLQNNSPRVSPGLQRAMLDFMFLNSGDAFARGTDPDNPARNKDLARALSILEELASSHPDYRKQEVLDGMAKIADELIKGYFAASDFRNARGLIKRIDAQYDAGQMATIGNWVERLTTLANGKKQEAVRLMEAGKLREAEAASREMIGIWPDLPGAAALALEIARRHPMVLVGVSETARDQDVLRIDNWAARRTGRLTQRLLLELIGAGPEGGLYTCPLGQYEQSDDRRQLVLELREPPEGSPLPLVTGYDVSRRLLAMADPASPQYEPAWGALVQSVRVEDVFTVYIDLRRPHVIPESMLRIMLQQTRADRQAISPGAGPFVLDEVNEHELRFAANKGYPFASEDHPVEIVERFFGTSQDAILALKRGDVDVLDYLFPADATMLLRDKSLAVERYALPTLHVLIPNYDNPFLANQVFRKAIVFGINRQLILEQELLGIKPADQGKVDPLPGCHVISGPFPIGTRENDPLAYAYDERIKPRDYNPRLGITLPLLAQKQIADMAKRKNEEPPELKPLLLGYPGNEVARVASTAIKDYLGAVGIPCTIEELPLTTTPGEEKKYDLLYAQVAVWEPVIDARRLLAAGGAAAVDNEYVSMALRRLDAAKNWPEARARLHQLHRIVHEQVAVIPLFQTVDYFAYTRRLQGVGSQPLSLYQNVEQWQITPAVRPPKE